MTAVDAWREQLRAWAIPDDNQPIAAGLEPEKDATLRLFNYADYIYPALLRRFEKRFSARRMAQDYVEIYQKQLSQSIIERRRRSGHAETARLNGDGLLTDTGLHVD